MALSAQIMNGVGAGFRAIGNGFAYIGRGIAHVSSETWKMWRDVFLEEYNGITQYTIGKNINQEPPSGQRSRWLHAASYISTLGILPTLLFLRTLLIDPFFYHNAQLTGPWFRSMADFGLPGEDKRYEDQDTPNYKGWARLYYIYAWPGAAVGAFVGSFFAAGHLVSSFVYRAFCAAIDTPAYLMNLESFDKYGSLKKNEMIGTGKNWAGVVGYYTLGIVLSIMTVPVFYAARIVGGSIYSFLKQAGSGIRKAATLGDEEETLDYEAISPEEESNINSKAEITRQDFKDAGLASAFRKIPKDSQNDQEKLKTAFIIAKLEKAFVNARLNSALTTIPENDRTLEKLKTAFTIAKLKERFTNAGLETQFEALNPDVKSSPVELKEAFIKAQKEKQERDAQWSVQDVLSLPGTFLGYGAYVVTGLATLAIRIPLNTVAATRNSIAIVVNASLYNFDKKPEDPSDDFNKILSGEEGKLAVIQKRTLTQQVLGSPGYLIGGAIGIVVAGFIGFGRGLVNLPLSFGYAFGDALDLAQADLALEPETEADADAEAESPSTPISQITGVDTKYFSPRKDERPGFLKILGGLGYGLGYITGLVGAVTVMVPLRFLTNSVDTIVANIMSAVDFAWNKPGPNDKWIVKLSSKNPKTVPQHIFSIPGYLLSIVTIPFTYVLTGFIASIASPITYGFDLANKLPKDFNAESAWQERNLLQKTVGVLTGGYFLGAALGITTFAVVGAVRIGWDFIVNCYKSGKQSYQAIANIPLEKNNEYEAIRDDRDPITAYAWGGLGSLIGLGVGIVGAAFFAARRTLYNSVDTFFRVSGSTMNVAIGHPYFNNTNVGKDQRGGDDAYGWGLIGAAVATPVIAVAATYAVFRLSAQYVAPFMGAAIFATPIAIGKLWNRWFGTRRFDEQPQQNDPVATPASTNKIIKKLGGITDNNSGIVNEATDVASPISDPAKMQRFKNLVSSLNEFGHFTENTLITENGTGRKGCFSFGRKMLTYNQSTPTEYILDQLLKAYKTNKHADLKDLWNSKICPNVREWYGHKDEPSIQDLGCTKEEKKAVNNMLNEIATFIINYIQDSNESNKKVPANLYRKAEPTVAQIWRGERLPMAKAEIVNTSSERVSISNN